MEVVFLSLCRCARTFVLERACLRVRASQVSSKSRDKKSNSTLEKCVPSICAYEADKYVLLSKFPLASGYDNNSKVITFPVDLYCHGYEGSGPGFNNVNKVFFPLAMRTQPDFKTKRVTFKATVFPFFANIFHSQLAVILLANCDIIRPSLPFSVHPQLHGRISFSGGEQGKQSNEGKR